MLPFRRKSAPHNEQAATPDIYSARFMNEVRLARQTIENEALQYAAEIFVRKLDPKFNNGSPLYIYKVAEAETNIGPHFDIAGPQRMYGASAVVPGNVLRDSSNSNYVVYLTPVEPNNFDVVYFSSLQDNIFDQNLIDNGVSLRLVLRPGSLQKMQETGEIDLSNIMAFQFTIRNGVDAVSKNDRVHRSLLLKDIEIAFKKANQSFAVWDMSLRHGPKPSFGRLES